jgi:acylphosphatase
MSRAVEVRITGVVQGVSFRAYAREEARRLGVTGWLRNEPDGSVAGHLEGPDDAVEQMITWCRSGPAYAEVDQVSVVETAPTGDGTFLIG